MSAIRQLLAAAVLLLGSQVQAVVIPIDPGNVGEWPEMVSEPTSRLTSLAHSAGVAIWMPTSLMPATCSGWPLFDSIDQDGLFAVARC